MVPIRTISSKKKIAGSFCLNAILKNRELIGLSAVDSPMKFIANVTKSQATNTVSFVLNNLK